MDWEVDEWGYWEMSGRSIYSDRPFEVEIIYRVDPAVTPGLVFRAPTPDQGMVKFCRDTFEAKTTLSLWELQWDERLQTHVRKAGPPLIDRATSNVGGAEVGGGRKFSKQQLLGLLLLAARNSRSFVCLQHGGIHGKRLPKFPSQSCLRYACLFVHRRY
jgi:hypothetical protein